jgi:group I intron endonuclease
MIIYKITNNVTGKVYVGQTTQLMTERWWQHCNRSPSQTHKSYIHNAIKEHGEANFRIDILATTETLDALNLLEAFYIKKLNTLAPNGYNLHPGGNGKVCHPETKVKISATTKGRPFPNRQNGAAKGRPVSEARKAQISATMTGAPQPWKYKAVVDSNGMTYESVNACSKALNVNRVTISGLIKSGKTGRQGLTFKFKSYD